MADDEGHHDDFRSPRTLDPPGLRCAHSRAPAAPEARSAAPPALDDAPWHFTVWTPISDNPVFAGTGRDTWDRKIRERGYILVDDDGTYHLWYTGYAADRPPTMSLGHATSRDGLHWERDPGNPIFSGSWVEDMCVVHRDGTYSCSPRARMTSPTC